MGLFGTVFGGIKGAVGGLLSGGPAGAIAGGIGGLLDSGPTNQQQITQAGTTGGTTGATTGFDPNSQAFIDAQRLQAQQAQQALQSGGSVTAGIDPLTGQAADLGLQQGQIGATLAGQGQDLFSQFFPQLGMSTMDLANQFQNPFQQQVMDALQAQFMNSEAIQQNQLSDQAIAAGAFGGTRFGVATGQRQADSARNQNEIVARMLSEQFNRNIGFAQQDRNQFLQGAQLGFQGQQAGANALGNAGSLVGGIGAFQRQVAQEQLRDDLFRAQAGQGLLQGGSGNFGTTATGTSTGTSNVDRMNQTPPQSALQRILAGAAVGGGIGDILRDPNAQPEDEVDEFGFDIPAHVRGRG